MEAVFDPRLRRLSVSLHEFGCHIHVRVLFGQHLPSHSTAEAFTYTNVPVKLKDQTVDFKKIFFFFF